MSAHVTERDPEASALSVVEQLGIPYEVLPCEPEFADTAAFCAEYGMVGVPRGGMSSVSQFGLSSWNPYAATLDA